MNLTSLSNDKPIRKLLETAVTVVIVACACWNIWVFGRSSDRLAPRDSEDVTVLEREYAPVRELLLKRGYRNGPVEIINNPVLTGGTIRPEDDGRWGQAQYVMVPWILVRGGRAVVGVLVPGGPTPFVVGDFWDAQPEKLPPDLIKIYEGPHISLFERKPQ